VRRNYKCQYPDGHRTDYKSALSGILLEGSGVNAEVQSMNYSLDLYETEGINSYLYSQIGNAYHSEAGGSVGGSSRSTRSGRARSTRSGTTTRRSNAGTQSSQTVTVSGQQKTVQTGSRGGILYQ